MAVIVAHRSQDSRQIQTENKALKQKQGGPSEPPCLDGLYPGKYRFGQPLVNVCVKISPVFHVFPWVTQI